MRKKEVRPQRDCHCLFTLKRDSIFDLGDGATARETAISSEDWCSLLLVLSLANALKLFDFVRIDFTTRTPCLSVRWYEQHKNK